MAAAYGCELGLEQWVEGGTSPLMIAASWGPMFYMAAAAVDNFQASSDILFLPEHPSAGSFPSWFLSSGCLEWQESEEYEAHCRLRIWHACWHEPAEYLAAAVTYELGG